jgi:thiamine kinase-like enzyme
VEQNDSVWVWLEDLTGVPQEPWTLERYGEAALLMGRFNGAYLGNRPMPVHPSLSQQWLEGWSAEGADSLRMLGEYRDDPYVQRMIPPDVEAALVHTWNRRPAVLDRLAAMPQTFCHLDAFHANAFFRETGSGRELVLIDWSFAGRAAVGEELAALCVAGIIFDPNTPYQFEEIEQVAFNAYVSGLRDSGWREADEAVWDTYRSAAILRYGLAPLIRMLPIMTNELARASFAEALGAPVDQAEEHLVHHYRWIADHASEL